MSKRYFQMHSKWLGDFHIQLWTKFTSGKKQRMRTFMHFFMDSCITCLSRPQSIECFLSGWVPTRTLICIPSTYTDRCGGRSRWACWWKEALGGPGRTVLPYPPRHMQTGLRSWHSRGSSHSSDVMHGFEISHLIFERDPPETSHRDVLVRPPSPQPSSS